MVIAQEQLPEVFDLTGIGWKAVFDLGVEYESILQWIWSRGSGRKLVDNTLWPLIVEDAAKRGGVGAVAEEWLDDSRQKLWVSLRTIF
jgi:hypothetical protein